MVGQAIVIRSEEDAWHALQAAVRDDEEVSSYGDFRFDGFPNIELYLNVGQASLTTPVMEIFVEYQKAVWRSFALIKYNDADISRLTDLERRTLTFEVFVLPGSTDLKASLAKAIDNISKEICQKMTGKQVAYVVLGLGLIYGATVVAQEYFQNKLEIRKAELNSKEKQDWLSSQKFLIEEDAKKFEALERAFQGSETLRDLDELASVPRQSVLTNVPGGTQMRFQGVEVSGDVANELGRNPRNEARAFVIHGAFSILRVDAQTIDGFRVRLRHEETGEEFTASLKDEAGHYALKEEIKKHFFDKKSIRLAVSVSRRAGKITSASIDSLGKEESSSAKKIAKK
jgi:hypothetical protein